MQKNYSKHNYLSCAMPPRLASLIFHYILELLTCFSLHSNQKTYPIHAVTTLPSPLTHDTPKSPPPPPPEAPRGKVTEISAGAKNSCPSNPKLALFICFYFLFFPSWMWHRKSLIFPFPLSPPKKKARDHCPCKLVQQWKGKLNECEQW